MAEVAFIISEKGAIIPIDLIPAITPSNLYTAGETISGQSIVVLSAGMCFKFDPLNTAFQGRQLGMTSGGVNAGDKVAVILDGDVVNPGWGLIPDVIYFAGLGGQITPTPVSLGISMRVGVSIDSEHLHLAFSEPVIII